MRVADKPLNAAALWLPCGIVSRTPRSVLLTLDHDLADDETDQHVDNSAEHHEERQDERECLSEGADRLAETENRGNDYEVHGLDNTGTDDASRTGTFLSVAL